MPTTQKFKSNYKLPFQNDQPKAWRKNIIITLIYHVLSDYCMDTMNWLCNTGHHLTRITSADRYKVTEAGPRSFKNSVT